MGYNLGIGEARCNVDMDDFYAWWDVEGVDGAPLGAPPDSRSIDNPTHENSIFPGYIAWANFAKSVGLWEVFFAPEGSTPDERRDAEWRDHPVLLESHPGIVRLTNDHLDAFENARAAYAGAVLDGEFRGQTRWTERTDEAAAALHRRRLDWLCWWTRWALENCSHPAFYNS